MYSLFIFFFNKMNLMGNLPVFLTLLQAIMCHHSVVVLENIAITQASLSRIIASQN